ncbi:MAG: O-antigen ligase family protein [Arenibacterium sp.]
MTDSTADTALMGQPAQAYASAVAKTEARKGLPFIFAAIYTFSALVPMLIPVGPFVLMPFRIVLLLLFIPVFIGLMTGRAGRILWADWLIIGAGFWAAIAMFANHGIDNVLEPVGINTLQFVGAYLLARTTIRNSSDFRKFVNVFFVILMVLVPFAAFESLTGRSILLEALPNSVRIVSPPMRWGMRRAQVLFSHPILFGVFCAIAFSLFFFVLKGFRRYLGMLLSAGGAFFSLSTGALMSVIFQFGFIVWELVTRPRAGRWLTFGILTAVAYVVVDLLSNRNPFHILVDYATFNTASGFNRILIWNFGTQNVADNPIFGIGMNDWARPSWMSNSVDNYWLLETMRYGLPFIIMYATAILMVMLKVARAPLSDPLDKACRAAFLTSMGGVILAGGTVHYWHTIQSFIMFLFGSGIWAISGGAKAAVSQTADALNDAMPARMRYSRGKRPPPRKRGNQPAVARETIKRAVR